MRNPVFAEREVERHVSPEEYWARERESDIRHEFLDGDMIAMAGESLSHSRVRANLLGEVRNKLKGNPCEPLSPNMKVRTSTASLFAYPDLKIVCGETAISRCQKRCTHKSEGDL
jgi:Uma2 family endonuclease